MTRLAVVRFPGSNCETESLAAIERAGCEGVLIDYRSRTLELSDGVILPGGFSYGDYLRSGAIARFAPIMHAVRQMAAAGGPVIGICNGFQILCEAHLLPGALQRNAPPRFTARPVAVRIERHTTVCTSAFDPGEIVNLPVAHGEGRYTADPSTLDQLEHDGLVVLRYADDGSGSAPANPNGSAHDIAGICNAAGNVVGFMPHPERAAESIVGSSAGQRFFASLAASLASAPA